MLRGAVITLYSYPGMFGVADNNGYGLKVFAFLRLAGVAFRHEHVVDASAAPRGQLPYVVDDEETIGDSETIIAHLVRKYGLTIDAALTADQRDANLLVTRMLDDLYWVMSYSRWKDERYWPAFRDALMRQHPRLTEDAMREAREYNSERYHFQGIGRYAPDAAYARGLADLQVLSHLVPVAGCVHGSRPTNVDAGIYGFVANIWFYDIETPLKQFVSSQPNLVRHCREIHEAVRHGEGGVGRGQERSGTDRSAPRLARWVARLRTPGLPPRAGPRFLPQRPHRHGEPAVRGGSDPPRWP